MSETIRKGDVLRTKSIRSPVMLVVQLHLQPDDSSLAELLWFDAQINLRQANWIPCFSSISLNIRPTTEVSNRVTDEHYIKIDTIYDREENVCHVVLHPDLDDATEAFAIFNSKTGLFKIGVSGKPKRFKSKETAGHIALVDSAMFKEMPNLNRLRYGSYHPKRQQSEAHRSLDKVP